MWGTVRSEHVGMTNLEKLHGVIGKCKIDTYFLVLYITWRWSPPLYASMRLREPRRPLRVSNRRLHSTTVIVFCRSYTSHSKPWIPTLLKNGEMLLLTSKHWRTFWTEAQKRPGEGEKSVSLKCRLCLVKVPVTSSRKTWKKKLTYLQIHIVQPEIG